MVTEEGEPAGGMKLKQPRQEQAAEQFGQDTDRQQEGRPRRHPARAVQRNATARHDHVDVRMVRQRRAPGVEHGGDADARAKMTRVGGDGEHGLRCRPEQQVVHDRLVVQGDVGDLAGNGEDDVEIPDRQQVGLARGQPFARPRPGIWGSAGCGSCCRRSPMAASSQPSTWPPSAAVRHSRWPT